MIRTLYLKRSSFLRERPHKIKCHKISKKHVAFIVFSGIPEKSELLQIVTAKMLQKHGKNRVSSPCALTYLNQNLLIALKTSIRSGSELTKCDYCHAEMTFPFQCYYCKQYFCKEHWSPESHKCYSAPKVRFRQAVLLSPVMILVGCLILYVAFMPSVMPPSGQALTPRYLYWEPFIFVGLIFLIFAAVLPVGTLMRDRSRRKFEAKQGH